MSMAIVTRAPDIESRYRVGYTHEQMLRSSLELVKRSSYHVRRSTASVRSADRALSRAALRLYDSLQLLGRIPPCSTGPGD